MNDPPVEAVVGCGVAAAGLGAGAAEAVMGCAAGAAGAADGCGRRGARVAGGWLSAKFSVIPGGSTTCWPIATAVTPLGAFA